ncbi:MAG: response regulator transcription factor [Pseudomonadota bacterium]
MSLTISIGIFDDHPVLGIGLRGMLAPYSDFQVNVLEQTRESLLTALHQQPVDVLILDVVAPDVEGLDLFKEIRTVFPDIAVMAYTTLKSPVLIENLMALGVQGYVNKRQPEAELIEAVTTVAAGKTWVPKAYEYLTKRSVYDEVAPVELSAREQEIVRMILDGKLSKEIAAELGISQKTVDNHRSRLFRKLEVNNVAELLKTVMSLGYSFE